MLPRLVRENRFCVIDVETADFGRTAEIVQIGLVQVDFGQPHFRASVNVRPRGDWVSPHASAVHGLTAGALQFSPSGRDVSKQLLGLIDDRCLIGFNIRNFDYPVLQYHFSLQRQVLDVLPWARRLERGGSHKLAAMAQRLSVPAGQAHDALGDCRTTWNVFLKLATLYPAFGELSLADAIAEMT